jgi:hypothetical protein
MAKAKKARSATRTSTRTSKRASPPKTVATRAKAQSARSNGSKSSTGAKSSFFDFIPSNLMKDILGSQTSRVIMAEALVAAAGAAAAVLAASRTETGQRAGKAAGQALADGGALMKDAAVSAAAAARDVIANGATEAIGSAARSLMGAAEETQHDIAEKALRLKREAEDAAGDLAESKRSHPERDRPH